MAKEVKVDYQVLREYSSKILERENNVVENNMQDILSNGNRGTTKDRCTDVLKQADEYAFNLKALINRTSEVLLHTETNLRETENRLSDSY